MTKVTCLGSPDTQCQYYKLAKFHRLNFTATLVISKSMKFTYCKNSALTVLWVSTVYGKNFEWEDFQGIIIFSLIVNVSMN